MGFVDFEKAFDTVEHNSLWEVLRAQGVGRGYIELLQTLYANQVGIVRASCDSKRFEVHRGVQQGDPMSNFWNSQEKVERSEQKTARQVLRTRHRVARRSADELALR